MAIYSFNHDSFGKTTNRAGAAGDNVAYNARENATSLAENGNEQKSAADLAAYNARDEATYAVRSHIIPPGPKEAEAWFREQEKGERKNARMSDRFIGALPRELTPEQCIEAVETFCQEVTQNRVPWHFALHLELDKKNEPDWNPHAHIIFRDRDIETGRRFLHTSAGPKERAALTAKGVEYWTTKDFREAWGDQMNRALERGGHDVRIDHRSLEEQGIDRKAQIHVGPASQKAASKGFPLDSHDQVCGDRAVAYTLLDEGTRAEHNARIVERNNGQKKNTTTPAPEFTLLDGTLRMNTMRKAGKALTERDPVPEAWNRFLADQRPRTREDRERLELLTAQHQARRTMYAEQRRDREALRQAHDAQGREHRASGRKLYADARQKAFEQAKQRNAKKWDAVRKTKNPMKRELAAAKVRLDQKHVHTAARNQHLAAARKVNDTAWRAMIKQQAQERHDLRAAHQKEQGMLARQQVAERLATGHQKLAENTQRAAASASARMSNAHGLAGQDKAADRVAGDHARFRHITVNGESVPLPANPLEASRAYLRLAHAEHAKRGDLRQTLTQQRDGRIASRQSALINAAGYGRVDRRTRAGRSDDALTAIRQNDPQSSMRQTAMSGQTLT